jgi:tetratricopeptide (TPR) repeat protein
MSLYYLQFSFTGNIAPKQFMPKAEAAARRAIELDDTLDEGHAVLGIVLHRFRWEWSASENEFRRALALNKNYAEAHRMFSEFLAETGRSEEAIAEARRARELDPRSLNAVMELGRAYRAAGQYDAALEEFGLALQKKAVPRVYVQLGNTHVEKGMLRDAIDEYRTAVTLTQRRNPMYLSSLAYVYARSGRTSEAQTILDELKTLATRQYVPPTAIARVYLGLGDKRAARPWIEKAYQERDFDLVSLQADIGLSSLRSDPDFHDVFSRVGLAH